MEGHKGFEGRMELDDSQVRELSPWGYFSHFLAISGWIKYILLHRYDIYILSTCTYSTWRRDSEMYLSKNHKLPMQFWSPWWTSPAPGTLGPDHAVKATMWSWRTASTAVTRPQVWWWLPWPSFYREGLTTSTSKMWDILVAKSSSDLWPWPVKQNSSHQVRSIPTETILIDFPSRIWRVFFFQLWWILSPKKRSDLMAISSSSNHSVGTIWVYISIRAMVSSSNT